MELLIGGADAARKAQAVGESVFTRVGFILARRKLPPLTETNIELLGAEHSKEEARARRRSSKKKKKKQLKKKKQEPG